MIPKGYKFAPIPVRGELKHWLVIFNTKNHTKYTSLSQVLRDYHLRKEETAWYLKKIRRDKGVKRNGFVSMFLSYAWIRIARFLAKNRLRIVVLEIVLLAILLVFAHIFWGEQKEARTRGYVGSILVNVSPTRLYSWELEKLEVKKAEAKEPTDKETVIALVHKYFGKDAENMLVCLKSENGGHNPTATNTNKNGSMDIGIMQINTPLHCGKIGEKDVNTCREKLKDPETNIQVGYQIFSGRGFNAWYGKTCRQFWK
jgi:hypothetical protein